MSKAVIEITNDLIVDLLKVLREGFRGCFRVSKNGLPEDAEAIKCIDLGTTIGIVIESDALESAKTSSEVIYQDEKYRILDPVEVYSGSCLYMCGQFIAKTKKGSVWDFQGIFLSKEDAVKACKDSNYFIAPVDLGEELPKEASECPGIEYPIAKAWKTNPDTTSRASI